MTNNKPAYKKIYNTTGKYVSYGFGALAAASAVRDGVVFAATRGKKQKTNPGSIGPYYALVQDIPGDYYKNTLDKFAGRYFSEPHIEAMYTFFEKFNMGQPNLFEEPDQSPERVEKDRRIKQYLRLLDQDDSIVPNTDVHTFYRVAPEVLNLDFEDMMIVLEDRRYKDHVFYDKQLVQLVDMYLSMNNLKDKVFNLHFLFNMDKNMAEFLIEQKCYYNVMVSKYITEDTISAYRKLYKEDYPEMVYVKPKNNKNAKRPEDEIKRELGHAGILVNILWNRVYNRIIYQGDVYKLIDFF